MKLKRRFEWFDSDNEEPPPIQIYRFHVAPEPRRYRLLLVAACLAPFMAGAVTLPAAAWLTKPAKVARAVPPPEPERKPIVRRVWQPPMEWKLTPDQRR